MEEEILISPDVIDKYELYDELFKCPICDVEMRSIFINDHFAICKLDKLKEIHDEVNKENKKIEKENKKNYHKILFKKIFEKLNEFNFDMCFLTDKLDFIKIDIFNNLLLSNKNLDTDNIKNFKNIINLNMNSILKGEESTFLTNFSNDINNNDNIDKYIHFNFDNKYTNDINKLYNINNNNKINYFSDINILNLISNTLNISIQSDIIILFIFIIISKKNKENILKVNLDNNIYNNNENSILNYLYEFNYIKSL